MKIVKIISTTMLIALVPLTAYATIDATPVISYEPIITRGNGIIEYSHPEYNRPTETENEYDKPEIYTYRIDVSTNEIDGQTHIFENGEEAEYEPGQIIRLEFEDYELHYVRITLWAHYENDIPFASQQIGQTLQPIRRMMLPEPETPEDSENGSVVDQPDEEPQPVVPIAPEPEAAELADIIAPNTGSK